MKKILFIITQSELGGAQRWVYDTTTHLNHKKYTITVATGREGPLVDNLKKYGIKTHVLKHLKRNINPLRDICGIIEIYLLIRREKPDILQLCSSKAGIIGSIAGCLARHKRVIYRIGGWSFNDPRPQWKNKLFLILETWTAHLKTKIIVNSHKGVDEALKCGVCKKDKLVLIYNGIEIKKEKIPSHVKTSPLFTIGTIANFYPTKGLSYLIHALGILSIKGQSIRAIIIGDGEQRPHLTMLIRRYNLIHVNLMGRQSDPLQFFPQMDCIVIPSVKEGIPYTLLEAMRAGMPIISTEAGGIPEIISNGKNGLLVPTKNAEELANVIELMKHNEKLRELLGAQARKDVEQYTIKNMINQVEKLYEKILA